MKTIKDFIEDYFETSVTEFCKIGASTVGVAFGMAFAYYFLDRIFG